MFERLLFPCFVFFLSLSRLYFLSHYLPVLCPAHQLPCRRNRRGLKPLHSRTMRSVAPLAIYHPPTGYETNLRDNFDYSETSAAIFQDESGDKDMEPSCSCDAELDDEIIGKAPSSPLFIQERKEPANLRQAYHSHEESLLPAQSFFAHTSTRRPENKPSSSQKRKSGLNLFGIEGGWNGVFLYAWWRGLCDLRASSSSSRFFVVVLAFLVRVFPHLGHLVGRGRFCTSLCCFCSQSSYPTAVPYFHLSVGAKEAL